MIKIYPHTLNIHKGVHPVSRYCAETLAWVEPDKFYVTGSLESCDCALINGPSAAPYCFDADTAERMTGLNKPIFLISDADGSPPDCHGAAQEGRNTYYNFLRSGSGIRACFYREWFQGFEPGLPFPVLPYDLVGYLWNQNPKDKEPYCLAQHISLEEFSNRPIDVLFIQSVNVKSRQLMFAALHGKPRMEVVNGYQAHVPIGTVLSKQSESKITIALEGAGIKCQRHCEAPVNSVMAMQDIAMRETYPWIDGINCIRLPYEPGGEGSFIVPTGRGVVKVDAAIEKLNGHLADLDRLFSIFEAGIDNAERYSLVNYMKNHIGKAISEYL